MQEERFIVKYITVNNCFAYLPQQCSQRLAAKSRVLRVLHKDINYYLSWSTVAPGALVAAATHDKTAATAPANNTLCLAATFARSLDIKEHEEVFVTGIDAAPQLTSLVVSAKTREDREIVELQSEKIQEIFLQQINIVARNQPIVIWVSKNLSVELRIDSLNPDIKYGRLIQDSEVHVNENTSMIVPTDLSSISNALSEIEIDASAQAFSATLGIPRIFQEDKRIMEILKKLATEPKSRICRLNELPEDAKISPYSIYMYKSQLEIFEANSLCRIIKVQSNRKDSNWLRNGQEAEQNGLVVYLQSIDDYVESDCKNYFENFPSHSCIYVSSDLVRNLNCTLGGKVFLQPLIHIKNFNAGSIEIICSQKNVNESEIRHYLMKILKLGKCLLNSNQILTVRHDLKIKIKLLPESCHFHIFDRNEIFQVPIILKDPDVDENFSVIDSKNEKLQINDTIKHIFQSILEKCIVSLKMSLKLNDSNLILDRENILISGTTGSGKSLICKLLSNLLQKPPYYVYTETIDCRTLKGKKVETIQKMLTELLSDANYYQYSVLFFDDIESITSVTNIDENTPDAMNANRTTDAFYNSIKNYQADHDISIVATCTDINKIGKKLREPRGTHFFHDVFKISPLEKGDRIKILKSNLEEKLVLFEDIDWHYYGMKTEGWVIKDLVVLSDKAAFGALKRHKKEKSEEPVILRDSDLLECLNQYTPLSLEGLNLYKGEGHNWSDIGGLSEVKSALIEILHWPLKYPDIFKDAPIKLQSGVLLYGMPGTGKTLLAAAIAKECELNFISIKGPELLSKYIGASEESVRNVFEKAHRAKPCVIFFDEFDSFAPRRGHDSTGVTDRVVNQLLTHLDGIESREGVAVVAATSRPDLLDPALLRPGRLDKILLCSLPTEAERADILEALCRLHEIEIDDLDLKSLAAITPNFTGADLNAVITQALLDSLDTGMNISTEDDQHDASQDKITQEMLERAVKLTRPSLSQSERAKYTKIYARFGKIGGSQLPEIENQRATLA